jgi:uncharacterized protein (TIGR00661 family)
MKILFLVQGEGRGHLTQAISMSQILKRAGHEIAGVMVGNAVGRTIPVFFKEQINAPVYYFNAPNIVYNGGEMNVKRTLLSLVTNLSKYIKSLRYLNRVIKEIQPDLIISFYETYSGLYNAVYGTKIPMICIAHQYLILHPDFTSPENRGISRLLINLNSRAASWKSSQKLALSFREIRSLPDQKLIVVPPLLRQEVLDLHPVTENFFLVYMTHHSLSKHIIAWHSLHPDVRLHCFWDKAEVPDEQQTDENLTFHKINSQKYLSMLASCRALVTTAGFESVCEAMYLGKPVMMVPVPNHFEQECNALDGVISGAGVMSKTFDLSVLLDYLPHHIDQSVKFRKWYRKGEAMFIENVEVFDNKPFTKNKILIPDQVKN